MNSKEVGGIAALIFVAEGFLLCCIPVFWHAGGSMGHLVGTVILNAHWMSALVSWMMALFLLILLALVGIALIVLGWWAILGILKGISGTLRDLVSKFEALSAQLTRNARDTAIDAGFVAVLGIASALVAYINTEDFLKAAALLKILAVAAMCYAALKAVILIPIRSTQILSGALMSAILAAGLGAVAPQTSFVSAFLSRARRNGFGPQIFLRSWLHVRL